MGQPHLLVDLIDGEEERSEGWRGPFLRTLARTCNVSLACAAANVDRQTAYNHRNKFPRFRARWDEMIAISGDILLFEARCRALAGKSDPASHVILLRLLEAHFPGLFGRASRFDVERLLDVIMPVIPEDSQQAVREALTRDLCPGGGSGGGSDGRA